MIGGRSGRDRMVVGFTTIYEIGVYLYLCCGFDSRTLFDKVCQWLAHVGGILRFPSPPQYNWNIVESGVKNHKAKPNQPYEDETLLSVQ